MLGRFNIPFPEPRFYAMGGMPTASIIRVLAGEAGAIVTDVDALVHRKGATVPHAPGRGRLIEPVIAIATAHRGKLPLAVASGGYRDTITRTLDRLAIRDWFDAMVTAEDTARHKPEPDVFLEAAKRLGADAARCVVFEDTDTGLEAARASERSSSMCGPGRSRSRLRE